MKKIIPIYFILLFSSCTDFFEMSVDVDIPEHKSKLAVTAFIGQNSEYQDILVSYSVSGLENTDSEEQLINDATIVLKDDSSSYTYQISDQNGIYTPAEELNLIAGKTYTLEVDAPNYESITSTQILPTATEIIEASYANKKLKVKFQDAPGVEQYYLIECYYKEIDEQGNEEWRQVWLDSFGTISFWSSVSNGLIFNDQTFDGDEFTFTSDLDSYYFDESNEIQLKVILYNTTKDFFKYDHSLALSWDTEGNPFAEPVIIHQNIDKGYGIFALLNGTAYEFTATID